MSPPDRLAETLPQPKWYTPKRLLLYFCIVLLLTWFDQGLFASNYVTGDDDDGNPLGVKKRFNLNSVQLGLLPATYAIGLIVAGFIFAELAKFYNSFRLIGVGMACWVLGAALTGASSSYGMLIFSRILVGGGEAPLLTLTFTFVDDVAPPGSATLWFGLLGLFPVLGSAAGFVLSESVTSAMGWRGAFYLEAALGVPIGAFALLMPPVHLQMSQTGRGTHPAAGDIRVATAAVSHPQTAAPPTQHPPALYAAAPEGPTVAIAGDSGTHVRQLNGSSGGPAVVPATVSMTAGWPSGVVPAAVSNGAHKLQRHRPPTLKTEGLLASGTGSGARSDGGDGVGSGGAAGSGRRGGGGGGSRLWGRGLPSADSAHLLTPLTAGLRTSSFSGNCGEAAAGAALVAAAAGGPMGPGPTTESDEVAVGAVEETAVVGASATTAVGPPEVVLTAPPWRPQEDSGVASRRYRGATECAILQNDGIVGGGAGEMEGEAYDGAGRDSHQRRHGWSRRRAWRAAVDWCSYSRWLVVDGVRSLIEMTSYPANYLNNFGYAPVQWVFGMVTFWGPKAVKNIYGLKGQGPELMIGAVAVMAGVLGTLAGGLVLDWFGSSLRNGFAVQAVAVGMALLTLEIAFMVAKNYLSFVLLLSLGLFCIFASQAPSYALSMWTVPAKYRPLSQAVIILLQHALGDVPSPVITGLLHDATGSWRHSMAISLSYLGMAVAHFFAGWILAAMGKLRDFRLEEEGPRGPESGPEVGTGTAGAGAGTGGAGTVEYGVSPGMELAVGPPAGRVGLGAGLEANGV